MIKKTKEVLEKELARGEKYLVTLTAKKKLVAKIYDEIMNEVVKQGEPTQKQVILEDLLNKESDNLLKIIKDCERKIVKWKERINKKNNL